MKCTAFLDLLFPPRCLSCLAFLSRDDGMCAACAITIPVHRSFFCGVCHARLPSPTSICHKQSPFALGAATDYDVEAVQNLIHRMKFESVKSGAVFLGYLVAHYLRFVSEDIPADLIVPIPLSSRRFKERGFNQAELISKVVSDRFLVPMETNVLKRTRESRPQSSLESYELREENIRGCFEVNEGVLVCNKRILLVDDVFTSGATAREAARVLKLAGAKKIIVVAAAAARKS
ncbi:MAG: ComF family protein [Patescibacteria group bacterium]